MSELVLGGVAAAAVGACVATAGAVAAVGYAAYRGITWLSEGAKREMERLEKELEPHPIHVTTKEAREAFEKHFTLLKAKAASNPALANNADAVARILAAKQSPLGAFFNEAQWEQFCTQKVQKQSVTSLIEKVARRFTDANAAYVSRSILEVAKDAGFVHPQIHKPREEKEVLVVKDANGRALVADVVASEEGGKINLDLTGFGDGSCHAVMDRILEGLAAKNIQISQMRRQSHFRREGASASAREYVGGKDRKDHSSHPAQERSEAESRRRQRVQGSNPVRVTH